MRRPVSAVFVDNPDFIQELSKIYDGKEMPVLAICGSNRHENVLNFTLLRQSLEEALRQADQLCAK